MTFTIKQARNLAGMTQAAMAECLGVDRSTYIKIEKDPARATIRQVMQIAERTGLHATDIFLAINSTKVEFEGTA